MKLALVFFIGTLWAYTNFACDSMNLALVIVTAEYESECKDAYVLRHADGECVLYPMKSGDKQERTYFGLTNSKSLQAEDCGLANDGTAEPVEKIEIKSESELSDNERRLIEPLIQARKSYDPWCSPWPRGYFTAQ